VKPRSSQKPTKVAAKAPVTAAPIVAAATPSEAAPIEAAPVPLVAPVAVGAPESAPPLPLEVVIGDDTAPLLALDQKPMTEAELVVEYQRVGRDIAKLQKDRGTDKVLDLWPTFRSIKLKESCKTAETRLNLEGTLKQLRSHIDRRRGITISADCMNNPLAANCQ
ncbi:MAG TPA: hypothetical protein VMZ53_29920, partial [Kofleriaceae bacterium]|nr:hypothetical protein [Kofleriaceae bacterium]